MDTTDPTVVNITSVPTTQEQIISGVISLAFIAAAVVVTTGSFALVGVVSEKIEARKARKAAQDNDSNNEE